MSDTRRLGVNIIRDHPIAPKVPQSDRHRLAPTGASTHVPALEVLKIEMQRLPMHQRLGLISQYCPG